MKFVFVLVATHVVAYAVGAWFPLDALHPWSLLAYGFTHGSGWHLAANMLALLSLGLGVEREAGKGALAAVYLTGVAGAGAAHLLLGPPTPVIGASGGVAAVLVAYAALNPTRILWLLVLPLRARYMVALVAGLALACLAFGWFPRIAHIAHLGGMAAGLVWCVWWFTDDGEKT